MGNMTTCKRGHESIRTKNNGCRECANMRSAAYRTKNLEKVKERVREYRKNNFEKAAYQRKTYRHKNRATYLISEARGRSKNKNLPFDIHEHVDYYQSVIDAGVCQATGLLFEMSSPPGVGHPNSPSLDRIVPKLGYVRSNVRVVLLAFNVALREWGEDVYAQVATAYLEKKKR